MVCLLAIAFLTALWLAGRLGAKVGIHGDRIMDIGLIAALAGILGAKLRCSSSTGVTTALTPETSSY